MLAILTTHPIQYQVPIWKALALIGDVPFEVWYLTRHGVKPSHDSEFAKQFSWDIDMLSGYPHRFLEVAPGASPSSLLNCRLRERLSDRLKTSGACALWVQGWQVSAYWQAVWEAKRAGVGVWLRGESNDLRPAAWWKKSIKRILLGQFFRRVDHFLYIGFANRRLYQKFGVPEERLHPAPYAVDNERFGQQAEALRGQRSEIRKEWNIPDDAFCVLFCGKFIPKKRPLDLVEAARLIEVRSSDPDKSIAAKSYLLSPNFSKVHLLFVGSGELGPQLRSSCNVLFDAEAPTSDLRPLTSTPHAPRSSLPSASFAGFLNQTEISKAYVAADCLVLPSDYGETWGLVVNEAMASGLPCIISDQCGSSLDLGRVGLNEVFSCRDIIALAECLTKMASCRDANSLAAPQPLPSLAQTAAAVASLYRGDARGSTTCRSP